VTLILVPLFVFAKVGLIWVFLCPGEDAVGFFAELFPFPVFVLGIVGLTFPL